MPRETVRFLLNDKIQINSPSLFLQKHHQMKPFFTLLLAAATLAAAAQNSANNREKFRYQIRKATGEIQLDGSPDEAAWQTTELISELWLWKPTDDRPASRRTEIRLTYDEKMLYIAATCFDDEAHVVQTLKRDQYENSDEFAVLIDPLGQKTNGYGFGINVFNAQTEVLLSANVDGNDSGWDNRWFSKTRRHADRWTLEIAIPFKTMRFAEGLTEWGINFLRDEPSLNERWVWAHVPRQFDAADLGFFGTLVWDAPPSKVSSNVSLIPYLRARGLQDFSKEKPTSGDLALGGDAKIALSPTLNLDLTANPDFSQVEVDVQQTNLTRFNLFFPERRQFFIENADIFNSFGLGEAQPFFSRRIGLDANARPVPILFGGRLTGNLTEKLRVGAFNMHTKTTDATPGQNYSAAVFQHRIWKRSSVNGIFLNRQAFDKSEKLAGDFGRNAGGDLKLLSADGRWAASGGYLHSFAPQVSSQNGNIYGSAGYNGTRFQTFVNLQSVGKNFFTDMGFAPRLENYDPVSGNIYRIGYSNLGTMQDFYVFPKASRKVNFHWFGLENFVWANHDSTGLNEWYTRARYFIFFKNTSQLRFRLNNNFVRLIFPFDLTETPLPTGKYNMTEFNVQFNSDNRRVVQWDVFTVFGEFFNGKKWTTRANLRFRAQPWGNFSVGIERNDIWLPQPYGNLDVTLATARAEINFSTRLFWTTFLQYNTQANNFNINSRLQWRFAPMSDLFLVYTDNYFVESFWGRKNRALVLKANYWLTL